MSDVTIPRRKALRQATHERKARIHTKGKPGYTRRESPATHEGKARLHTKYQQAGPQHYTISDGPGCMTVESHCHKPAVEETCLATWCTRPVLRVHLVCHPSHRPVLLLPTWGLPAVGPPCLPVWRVHGVCFVCWLLNVPATCQCISGFVCWLVA